MTISYTPEIFDPLVSRVFVIEGVTLGDPKDRFLVRYVGKVCREDTAAAYDELSSALKHYNVTPLFRWEGDRHAIILIPGFPTPKPSNPWINVILFGLTVVSVMLAGAMYAYEGPVPESGGDQLRLILANIEQGWPFAVSLLSILLAHEFGHYIAGRIHRTHVSLPYFIPFPSLLGTMGAFINMKEPPKNRRTLLDIGIAGPLSGLLVAVPVLLIGLSLSTIDRIPLSPNTAFQLEGNSLLYLLAKYAVFGEWLPAPANYDGLSPMVYWVRYFFTGQPLPLGGVDVMVHPVAMAGWAGILVTSLNLIPAGQLDGGHMLYVLFGSRQARRILPFILLALVLLGFFWSWWWLWAALIFLLGRAYAEPLDQITPLDSRRKFLAVLALVVFVLVFTPVPLVIFGL